MEYEIGHFIFGGHFQYPSKISFDGKLLDSLLFRRMINNFSDNLFNIFMQNICTDNPWYSLPFIVWSVSVVTNFNKMSKARMIADVARKHFRVSHFVLCNENYGKWLRAIFDGQISGCAGRIVNERITVDSNGRVFDLD